MPAPDGRMNGILGLEWIPWMMAPSERLALIGLLAVLRPTNSLEFGCAEGGLTSWLSEYSEHVVSVDIDAKVLEVPMRFSNVEALCMTTAEAGTKLRDEGRRFDLAVIDADHSYEGMRCDLENTLDFCDIILMHDTHHPPCRQAVCDVLADRNVFCDLDLIPGGMQADGLWGGLGLVLTGVPADAERHVMARTSTYEWLRRLWMLRTYGERTRAGLRRVAGGAR